MNPFVTRQFCFRSMHDGRTVTDEHKNTYKMKMPNFV